MLTGFNKVAFYCIMYKQVFNIDKNAYKCTDISKQNKWLIANLYYKDFIVLLLSVFTVFIHQLWKSVLDLMGQNFL